MHILVLFARGKSFKAMKIDWTSKGLKIVFFKTLGM